MSGSIYIIRNVPVTRAMGVDDPLMRVSAPSTGILEVIKMWLAQDSIDDLNEPFSCAPCRLSTDGVGGATTVAEPYQESLEAFPGTHSGIDAAWGTPPTITDVFDETQGNMATGWEWVAESQDDRIVVAPSQRIGFKILNATTSARWLMGMRVAYKGS